MMSGDFRGQGSGNGWCILRMSGGSTLPVANALTDAGFEVWTPAVQEERRVGKSRARRQVTAPLTPGFVFARDHQIHELVALSRAPSLTYEVWNREEERMERRGCPYFSVFRHQGRYPRVIDRSLDPLRQAEQRAAPRGKGLTFVAGQDVRCPEAGFDGLVGKVREMKGRHALVIFPGFSIPVQIDGARLLPAKSAA